MFTNKYELFKEFFLKGYRNLNNSPNENQQSNIITI